MPSTPAPRLSSQERRILAGLGGRRWTARSFTPERVADARHLYADVRAELGFKRTPSGWLTTDKTNPKLAKNGVVSVGVTLHAASAASAAWRRLDAPTQDRLATLLDTTVKDISRGLRASVCPRSTAACRSACVVAHSANGRLERSQVSRLGRSLMTLFAPRAALQLTAAGLARITEAHGRRGARWRVNVSDDIRWEFLAPGLFTLGPRPYAYTKWAPEDRPGRPGLRLVYSATEKTTVADIVTACGAGDRVAVIFDVRRSQALPTSWHGLPVVDGDKTDDLWSHPAGVVVGLRAKGRTATRQAMRSSGFSRPADSVYLLPPQRRPVDLAAAA